MDQHKIAFPIRDILPFLIREDIKIPQRGKERQIKSRVLIQQVTDHLNSSSAQLSYFDQIFLKRPERKEGLMLLPQAVRGSPIHPKAKFMPCCLMLYLITKHMMEEHEGRGASLFENKRALSTPSKS